MNWQRTRFYRQLRVRPRLFIATTLGLCVGILLPEDLVGHWVTRWLIAWNVGTGLYLVLATVMMLRSATRHIRQRAQLQDDGQRVILVLLVVAAVASLAAIAVELAVAKNLHGFRRSAHIALAGLTVVSSWAFIQMMFALHYAHEFYAAVCKGEPGGLQFPAEEAPDYGDFFYLAVVIGTSGQTADVSFASRSIRRIGTLHCIVAYLFNTTVLALLINIAATLF